jgi:hypothetical protein
MLVLDYSLSDKSAELARKILSRGAENLRAVLENVCGGDNFVYIACPDFSISLRQRRLILGLPIGGYVKWDPNYKFFPLELDVNSCGVHMLKLSKDFDLKEFEVNLFQLKKDLDAQALSLNGTTLKWNFSRRNHFINIYKGKDENLYLVSHSSGETVLFDWENLHRMFDVKHTLINNRMLPYIQGEDVDEYFRITKKENQFFFDRHTFLFDKLLKSYEIVYADQHFGMINQGEILMGCSKIKPGTIFPLLTRPFAELTIAKTTNPPIDILNVTNGYALVPHGLGMTLPDNIVNITPSEIAENYVDVSFANGSKMVTDTLEYVGVNYREVDVIPQMSEKIGFDVIETLSPVLFTKI